MEVDHIKPSCWLLLTTPCFTISQIGYCVECRACLPCFSSARMCQVSQGRRIASHCELDFSGVSPISSSLLSMLVGGTGELPRRSQITCPSPCHGRELHSDRDRGYRRANIDEEFARWAAAPERYFSSLTGTTPRTGFEGPQGGLFPEAPPGEGRAQAVDQVPREASSLKLLRERVNPQKSSQDSRCGNPTQR